MAALPYIQLYVADYLADTMHLTTEENGAYLLIIMNYWQTGKPLIPNRLASITRMHPDKWGAIEGTIKEFFTTNENGHWVHDRIEDDLHKVLSKSIKASRAGRKSAEKRALQATEKHKNLNERSTDVPKTLQRKGNHTDTNTDTYTNTDTVDQKIRRFKKPSFQELSDYCLSKKLDLDINHFIDYYESNGWMVGRNKMKDWKASVRNWAKRNYNNGENNGRPSQYQTTSDRFMQNVRDNWSD